MREILFKAKRIDNGEWVEGYIFKLKGTERYFIFTGEFDITGLFPNYVRYEVVKETICQYTGLTDKNGQNIWENDSVRHYNNHDDLAITNRRIRFKLGELSSFIDDTSISTTDAAELKSRIVDVLLDARIKTIEDFVAKYKLCDNRSIQCRKALNCVDCTAEQLKAGGA